jgi:hypothetical protein
VLVMKKGSRLGALVSSAAVGVRRLAPPTAVRARLNAERRETAQLSLLRVESVGFAKGAQPTLRTSAPRKSPARFPGRAQLVSFNFPNTPICRVVSMQFRSPDGALA